jgi:hypothetical protein|tara:strand:- start:367 stop:714 length:348 start_codon:yes stop_codon:yes gene_type:complete
MAKPGWYSLKVKDGEVKQMSSKLQSAETELYTSLAANGSQSVGQIESRIRDAFPGREKALELDWKVDMDGLGITLTSSSEGLLDSIRDQVVEIINDEMKDMSVNVQRDFSGRITR